MPGPGDRRLAFCFPGQGSQAVGMGRALHDASKVARDTFEEASHALGFDVARLCFEGPEPVLQLTANTQPAVLTVSVAAGRVLAEHDLVPGIVGGHSLGEFSALVAAGALAFRDAVRLVRARGEFMQEAVPVGVGAMAALLGVELAAVEAICDEARGSEVLAVANINSPVQVVVAGHRGAVERAVALAQSRGGRRSVMLPVSAPFHCPLMTPAAERLAQAFQSVTVSAPRIPVVRNVDGGLTTAAAEVVPALVRQVTSPVRWTECVARMAAEGVRLLAEVGPGRVLTGLARRIDPALTALSVEDPGGIPHVLAARQG
jgi:[acyl-carrier-protein] S-malonyltransferase